MITKQVIEDDNMQTETSDPAADKLDIQLDPGMTKRKKKARKKLAHRKSSNSSEGYTFALWLFTYMNM